PVRRTLSMSSDPNSSSAISSMAWVLKRYRSARIAWRIRSITFPECTSFDRPPFVDRQPHRNHSVPMTALLACLITTDSPPRAACWRALIHVRSRSSQAFHAAGEPIKEAEQESDHHADQPDVLSQIGPSPGAVVVGQQSDAEVAHHARE